jgi:hypothetical protein
MLAMFVVAFVTNPTRNNDDNFGPEDVPNTGHLWISGHSCPLEKKQERHERSRKKVRDCCWFFSSYFISE